MPTQTYTAEETAKRRAKLRQHERVIERGLSVALETGYALMRIFEAQLYREGGYKTWADYVSKRWGIARRRADQLRTWAEVCEDIRKEREATGTNRPAEIVSTPPGDVLNVESGTNCSTSLPSEGAARQLGKLDTPAERAAAFMDACEDAAPKKPTARHVEQAVERLQARRDELIAKSEADAPLPPWLKQYDRILKHVRMAIRAGSRRDGSARPEVAPEIEILQGVIFRMEEKRAERLAGAGAK